MPVGTKATVKSAAPGRGARARRERRPRQHVPPALPAGRGPDRRARRAPRVHGLGRPDPDRLGRLPGLLAARHAARASTTTASRSAPSTTARRSASRRSARRAIQAQPRLGHRHVPRHLPAARTSPRASSRRPSAARRSGPSASADAPRAPGPAPLRDRPGRRRPGAAPPLDRGDRRARLRRLRARRPRRRGEREEMLEAVGWAAPLLPGGPARATSWASATPRASSSVDRARHRHVRLRPADAHRAHRLGAHLATAA